MFRELKYKKTFLLMILTLIQIVHLLKYCDY